MSAKAPILFKTRICDADRTALAADNADYTVNKGSKPNLIFVAQVDEEVGTYTTTYTLMWKNTTDTGAFANLAATGQINWAATTNLVQGTDVTTKLCTAAGAAGSTWQNGEEVEGAATSDSIALVDEYYTEIHFAINLASALEGKTYDFQIWENTGGTALAVAAAASLIVTSDQPTVVLNTADLTDFGADTTPTLEFTGTDASASDVRYQIQIDTVNTFNSVVAGGVNTYYFDGSDAPASDPNNVWTDETNADDGDTGTVASTETQGTIDTNYLMIEGTNAPNPGDVVTKVRIRAHGASTSGSTDGRVYCYTDGWAESLGFCIVPVTTPGWGNYVILSAPTGGWTWNKVQGLEVRAAYLNVLICTLSRIEIEVTSSGTPFLDKLSGTDAGFAGTPDNTDPFASAQLVSYTVQAGEELATGTYYWRVRGLDPSPGSGLYGAWAATKSFTVDTGGAPSAFIPRIIMF